MNYCGLDLGKKSSRFCIVDSKRKTVEEGTVRNTSENLIETFGRLESMRIVIEASGKAFWVADILETCGHIPIVVDPGRTKAIGAAKIKHDKLDARVLAQLCAADILAPVDRPDESQRYRRMPVTARGGLVRCRTILINQVRGMLDSEGIILKPCRTEVFVDRVTDIVDDIPKEMFFAIEPVLNAIDTLTEEIDACGQKLEASVAEDNEAKLVMTAPGVGPIVAACFLAAVRDASRFESGRQLAAYLGLVPSLYQSGNACRLGRITKHGNKQARWALCIAANSLLSARTKKESALRSWGLKLVERTGKKKAVIAVARKLASVLWSMLRNNKPFEPRLSASA